MSKVKIGPVMCDRMQLTPDKVQSSDVLVCPLTGFQKILSVAVLGKIVELYVGLERAHVYNRNAVIEIARPCVTAN